MPPGAEKGETDSFYSRFAGRSFAEGTRKRRQRSAPAAEGRRMGSVEPGKDADLAVWSGNPFSNLTLCEKTIVDGEVYDNLENGLD